MMTYGEIIILDVGHGNCTIIKHGEDAIIIDAPGKPIVAKALDELKIKSIHALLISHSDSDHLSGAIPILMNQQRPVKQVYVNPDNRATASWLQFRIAAGEARKNLGTKVHASLSIDEPQNLTLEKTTLNILHPSPEMCLATNNGQHTDGVKLNSNSMSAVISVEHDGERICLLAADSGQHSLDSMMNENININAKVLVFPHHGGLAGGAPDNKKFAKDLVSSVKPKLVLFSLGRGVHSTPRPEIIEGSREASCVETPYIACTQISKNCADILPSSNKRSLFKHSDGASKNHCCAGTIVIPLVQDGVDKMLSNLNNDHGTFVSQEVPKALCKRKINIPIHPV